MTADDRVEKIKNKGRPKIQSARFKEEPMSAYALLLVLLDMVKN